MKINFMTEVKKFVAFLFITSILASVSYLMVYKFSFLPNGYKIESRQKENVSLKSFNWLGIEKERITRSYSENDMWKMDDIVSEVKRQKVLLWLVFTSSTVSLFLLVYKVCSGLKFWKALLESNILATLAPLISLIYSLNRILDLIS